MRRLWVSGEVAAPAPAVWALLADPAQWPRWGPSVRGASLDGGRMRAGATGRVLPIAGPALPFRVTAWEDGRAWAWAVAGVAATDHRVDPLVPGRCRVAFGVPWVAAPYLLVCRRAIANLRRIAEGPGTTKSAP